MATPERALSQSELQVMSEVTDIIARAADTVSDIGSIYSAALRGLQRAVGIERASILLFDPDGVMRFKAWLGISDSYRETVEGHTPWSQNALNPSPIVVFDVQQDSSLTLLLPTFAEEKIRAVAFIPLVYQGRILGKFMLYSGYPHHFKKEIEFALILGKLIAFAIVRRNTEESLRVSEALFRATFDLSPIGKILLSPPEGKFLRVNTRFSEMIGYSPEELLAMTFTDITHADDRRQDIEAYKRLLSGDLPRHLTDKRCTRKDGQTIIVSISATPLRDEAGRVMNIFAAVQDITDQKLGEETRQKALRRYQELVDSIDGIVWEVTADFQFTFVSKQAEKILGYPIERWKREPAFWADHIHPDDREWVIAFCKERCAKLEPHDFEYRMISADGRAVWLRDIVNVVAENGRLMGLRGIMVDITAHRLLTEERESSLSLLHATLESTADGILMVDRYGKMTGFNQKFVQLWRLPDWIVETRDVDQAVAHVSEQLKDPEGFLKRIKELYANPELASHDVLELKDGRVLERYSQAQRIDHRVVGRVWSFRDVTEKRRADQALRETASQLSLIYNSATDLMSLIQVEPHAVFRFVSVSDSWAKATGRPPGSFIGKRVSEIITPSEYQTALKKYGEAIRTQKTVLWEDTYLQPNGPVTVETAATPIFNSDRQCTHLLTVSRDVSSKRREERRQRYLAKVSDALLDSIDFSATLQALARVIVPELASCCSIDTFGDDKSLVRLTLTQSDAETGRQAKEARRPFLLDLNASTGVPRVLRTGKSEIYPEPNQRTLRETFLSNGCRDLSAQTTVSSIMLVPLSVHGKTLGVVSFISSEPLHRYTPDDLQLAEELCYRAALAIENAHLYSQAQRAIQVREDFISVASHELKTPLTSLIAQVQLINRMGERGTLVSLPKEKLSSLLTNSQQQLHRFSALINELLDASRVRVGKLALEIHETDLSDVVRRIVDRFQNELNEAGCIVRLQMDAHAQGAWDPLRMEQVVINLLTNAMKFGAGKPIEISLRVEDGTAKLIVHDQGIGISREDHTRIFERFERATSIKRYGGLGLGLFITREIVNAHGGSIRVESEPGQGSYFIVELPLATTMDKSA